MLFSTSLLKTFFLISSVYRLRRRTQRWAWTAWSWLGPATWSSRASSRPYTASAARSSSPPSSSRWSSKLTTFAHLLICNQWITAPHVSAARIFLKLCGIVLSKLPRVCCADFFSFTALCIARLAPIMSCAVLQFCFAALCLASWHQYLSAIRVPSQNFLRSVVLWARRLVPHFR